MATVLVTGASRGIGRATARLFAERGWKVAIHYHQSEAQALALAAELTQLGATVWAVQADVADAEQVRRMVALVEAHLGEVDVLVNNAGIAQQTLFLDLTEPDWDRMLDVNVKGLFLCTRAVLRPMINRGSGAIVTVSSIWGLTGGACEVSYSASKAAVIGFTKALAKELGPSGIRVNCVAPGVIDTDMNATLDADTLEQLREQTPLGVIGSAQDVAESIYFLASSDAAKFLTGQVLSPNGGLVI